MSKDIECPYCGQWQEINHDDGYGYEEDTAHNQECGNCDKTFVFYTSISFYYESQKADCLNGSEHEYKPSSTFPRKYTKMVCKHCDDKRPPTESELKIIVSELPFDEIITKCAEL